jgi:hypothetical protein
VPVLQDSIRYRRSWLRVRCGDHALWHGKILVPAGTIGV